MALNPIDLQTMYSQIDKVAKQASHLQQGVQLAESMQQVEVVKQNAEQSQKVHSMDESAKSNSVNQDGKNDSQNSENGKQKKQNQDIPPEPERKWVKEDYLGNHIDITR